MAGSKLTLLLVPVVWMLLCVCYAISTLLFDAKRLNQESVKVLSSKGENLGLSPPTNRSLDNSFQPKAGEVTLEKHGHFRDLDSYQKVPWKFDKRIKNPCWFEEDGLKCLPYFFLVGMKKSGTTTLFNRLRNHPEFVFPGFKEADFFGWKTLINRSETKNIYNYIKKYASAAKQIQELYTYQTSEENPIRHIFGDGSPSNADINHNWRKMPSNEGLREPRYVTLDYIHRIVPTAKIIIMFRNPVDRFYSDFSFSLSRKALKKEEVPLNGPAEFHEFVKIAISNYSQCTYHHTLRSCVYNNSLFTACISLSTGIYHVYWQELLRLFPREQIHVIHTQDLDSTETMRRVFNFLEMSPVSDEVLRSITGMSANLSGTIPNRPMWNSTRKMLYDFYRPHSTLMAHLTGDSKFLYPN